MANTSNTLVHLDQPGSTLTVESGGVINVLTGGKIQTNGTDAVPVANPLASTSTSKKMVAGTVTLGGSNPTAVATGLTAVTSAVACIQDASTPGLDPVILTVDFGGGVAAGTVNIYAWKFTSSGNPTLIASTNNAIVVTWFAFGS